MSGFELKTVLTVCSLIVTATWHVTDGSAVLELKMNVFDNSPEKVWDGSCCDFLCLSRCDHIFHFSLDRAEGSQTDYKSGSIFSQKTGVFQDVDVNNFQGDMVGVSNPIVTAFREWPGRVLFKLFIEEDDTGFSGNDDVDAIISILDLVPEDKTTATWNRILLRGLRQYDKTSLSLDYKLYCDVNYYGPRCATYCAAQDSADVGHYTCNPSTGDVVCLPGWKNTASKCLTLIDSCAGQPCQNGGTCVNDVGAYRCICQVGYTGTNCEILYDVKCPAGVIGHSCDVKLCDFIHCLSGGSCVSGVCKCSSGYAGMYCERKEKVECPAGVVGSSCDVKLCDFIRCQNGGSCINGKCKCSTGYSGTVCEIRNNITCKAGTVGQSCDVTLCDFISCLNGGSCTEGACICPAGYSGTNCEEEDKVQPPTGLLGYSCGIKPCLNGGSCVDGFCRCPTGCKGDNCEECNICTLATCFNDGKCVQQPQFRCECSAGFKGTRCDVLVSPGSNASFERYEGQNVMAPYSIDPKQVEALRIALIVLSVVFVIAIIILIGCLCRFKRRADNAEKDCTILSKGATSSVSDSEKSQNIYNGALSSVSSDYQGSLSKCPIEESDYDSINPVGNAYYLECAGKCEKPTEAPKPPARPAKYQVANDYHDAVFGELSSC